MALDPQSARHLIFDLDDTLFDTFGFLVQPAMNEACEAMIKAGLRVDLETCKKRYHEEFLSKPRQNVFMELVHFFGVKEGQEPKAVAQTGSAAFYGREIKEGIIPFEGVIDTLEKLGRSFGLSLVTFGSPQTQMKKIEILRIKKLFSEIIYVDLTVEQTKKRAFQTIMSKFPRWEPHAFVSIGNRIDSEIRNGKELRMQTVLMLHGEYLHLKPHDDLEIPDAKIKKITDLLDLFGHDPAGEK